MEAACTGLSYIFVCQAIIDAQCVTHRHVLVPSDVHTIAASMLQNTKTGVCCCMSYLENDVICGRKKVKFIRIDGSTPAQSRGELVNKFQQNSDVRVAILSINAAGTGLTLTVSPFSC